MIDKSISMILVPELIKKMLSAIQGIPNSIYHWTPQIFHVQLYIQRSEIFLDELFDMSLKLTLLHALVINWQVIASMNNQQLKIQTAQQENQSTVEGKNALSFYRLVHKSLVTVEVSKPQGLTTHLSFLLMVVDSTPILRFQTFTPNNSSIIGPENAFTFQSYLKFLALQQAPPY